MDYCGDRSHLANYNYDCNEYKNGKEGEVIDEDVLNKKRKYGWKNDATKEYLPITHQCCGICFNELIEFIIV